LSLDPPSVATQRRRPVGRVGRPHGVHGAFYVEAPDALPETGGVLGVAGVDRAIVRRRGLPDRPLLELEGIADRDAAAALRGETLTASVAEAPLDADEWLADDLVGCLIDGVGEVRSVIRAPSCDLLEAGPRGVLVPFVRDAIRHVDVAARRIEVDRRFLGLDQEPGRRDPGERRPAPEAASR
jgi:16S rRNA processing protein RimM